MSGELTWNEGERMRLYFGLRASQVILVVVETFLDLTIESREFILSLRLLGLVKNSTFSLYLMEREWVGVFVVAWCLRCLIK